MSKTIRVTIWNEFRHELKPGTVQDMYPDGIHEALKKGLVGNTDFEIRTATLDDVEHGLTDEILESTDVMLWWGHMAHGEVDDEIAKKVQARVLEGMGLIPLHSAHFSKPFKLLMGTNCSLKWREIGEKERLWNLEPGHPITEGIGEYIELPNAEMYGERFDIPTPDTLVFVSWFQGGEVFRSGCCWDRGHGRVFYFRPGHETYPIYYNEEILKVIANAIRWAKPRVNIPDSCENPEPLEEIEAVQTN